MDREQSVPQRANLRARRIAVPFEVGSFPKELPHVARSDEPQFSDRFFKVFAGAVESGTDEEEFDAGAVETLPFPNLVPQVQRWTAVRPELLFESGGVFGDFGFCKSHKEKLDEVQGWVGCKGGKDSGGTRSVMLRACPGTRRMKPRRSSVRTMECTLGGVIWKNRCMSASAGAQLLIIPYWWM